jgi:hypothetical protein
MSPEEDADWRTLCALGQVGSGGVSSAAGRSWVRERVIGRAAETKALHLSRAVPGQSYCVLQGTAVFTFNVPYQSLM